MTTLNRVLFEEEAYVALDRLSPWSQPSSNAVFLSLCLYQGHYVQFCGACISSKLVKHYISSLIDQCVLFTNVFEQRWITYQEETSFNSPLLSSLWYDEARMLWSHISWLTESNRPFHQKIQMNARPSENPLSCKIFLISEFRNLYALNPWHFEFFLLKAL